MTNIRTSFINAAARGDLDQALALARLGASVLSLHSLVKRQNKLAVVEAVRNGAAINAIDTNGNSPLGLAMSSGNEEIIHILFRAGGDLLTAAVCGGSTPVDPTLDVMWPQPRSRSGEINDIPAAASQAVDACVSTNASLHELVRKQDVEGVARLILYGVDVNAVDADGYTPLGVALECSNERILSELFIAGADILTTDRHGHRVLDKASNGRRPVNSTSSRGKTPPSPSVEDRRVISSSFFGFYNENHGDIANIVGDRGGCTRVQYHRSIKTRRRNRRRARVSASDIDEV